MFRSQAPQPTSQRVRVSILLAGVVIPCMSGCAQAPYRPCSQAGDLAGLPLVQGDFRCQQRKLPDGSWVNHGIFKQLHPDGYTTALEGQFKDGVRTGKWLQYSPQGKLISELYFDERGVLKVGNAPISNEPALKSDPESPLQPRVRE